MINEKRIEKVFKIILIFAIVCFCLLLIPQVKNLAIKIGERILGRSLNHDIWMKKMLENSLGAICFFGFFLAFSLTFILDKIETSRNGYDRYIAVSILFLFSLLCFLFITLARFPYIDSDGLGYWKYLPGLFIDKDLSFRNKYTIGVALMEVPFFLAAHVSAILINVNKADGYSLPYQLSSLMATMFYSNLGLIFTYKSLRKFYSVKTSAITLAVIAFSTGLFFYTFAGANFSHVFSFCTIAIFLYYVYKSYETARIKDHIVVGLLLGVIACCRVPNAVVVLIYIFYGINSPSDFIEKTKLRKTYLQFAASFISFLSVFSLQMLYWKYAFGSFIINSYYDINSLDAQGFLYLFNPQIYNVLFSLWRGLFIWHPIYLFMFVGFYFFYKDKNQRYHLFGMGVFLILYLWITSSWWCWWYGWSFGQRSFNDILTILALPLAALIEKVDNISLSLFGEAHSPNKSHTAVKRLPFAVLMVFICWLSIRNLIFSLILQKRLFPMYFPGIHDYTSYKFSDFIFILKLIRRVF
jgi:hypothetical protein